MTRQRLLYLAQIGVLAGVYLVTAKLGLTMDAVAGFATLVWPPTGISLAALLLFGYRLWPGIALGALLANSSAGAALPVALGISLGNTAEAVLGAYALRRVGGFRPSLDRLRDVVGVVALAALSSTVVSATIGVGSLALGGVVSIEQLGPTWRAWWLGDVMGDLIVAPLLLVWLSKEPVPRVPQPWSEMLTLGTSAVVVSALVFAGPPLDSPFALRQPYMLFPVFAWAALRSGQRGTTLTLLVTAAIAIWGTAQGQGPFVRPALAEGLFTLQTFMGVSAAMFLILAAAISERVRVAGDLQEAVRARDAFISIASHELRTPLSALQLQVDLLVRGGTPAAPARQGDPSKRIERIHRQVARLTKLIDDLLDVSRLTVGSFHLELEEVELRAVVDEVVSRHAVEAGRRGSQICVHASKVPVVGRWDRGRLEQIVENLLGNALKYGDGKPIDVSIDAEGETACLRVVDQGIGIAPELQARIFEKFERLVSAKEYGGLGLGLWIVRQIVEALGGRIRVVSEVGAGATFLVELPCIDAGGNGEPSLDAVEGSAGPPRALRA